MHTWIPTYFSPKHTPERQTVMNLFQKTSFGCSLNLPFAGCNTNSFGTVAVSGILADARMSQVPSHRRKWSVCAVLHLLS